MADLGYSIHVMNLDLAETPAHLGIEAMSMALNGVIKSIQQQKGLLS